LILIRKANTVSMRAPRDQAVLKWRSDMRKYLFPLVLAGTFGTSTSLQAADAAHGKELHDANCTRCHIEMKGGDGSALYTRSDRKVKSYSELEAQVRRCEANLNLLWFDEDVADVGSFLNQEFYKLPKP
jgi:hypothetical protein